MEDQKTEWKEKHTHNTLKFDSIFMLQAAHKKHESRM